MSGILHPPPSESELELLSFLSSDNWQVRQVALSNLAGFSAKTHPRRGLLLLQQDKLDVLSDLKRLTMDLTPTAHDAFSCLINLSDSILVSRRIATPDYLSFLVTYIFHPSSLLADLASMLLSNLTKLDSAVKQLVEMKLPGSSLGMPDEELTALELLLAAFDQGATVKASASSAAIEEMKKRAGSAMSSGNAAAAEEAMKNEPKSAAAQAEGDERKSHCNFLASVFANVTVTPSGREYFTTPLTPPDCASIPLGRLFPYTEHPDLIRRGGVISSLKNALFVKSAHPALVAAPASGSDMTPPLVRPAAVESSTLDVLPALLLPLCDGSLFSGLDDEEQLSLPDELQFLEGEGEGKHVERDSALRGMLVESLLLLGTTLYGRRCMRERGVYVVVRELHKKEHDEQIGESILRLVNLLKREESAATLADAEGGDDDEGEDGQKSKDQKAIDELIGAEQVKEDDEDDLVIEEL
ncbi:hypothetical protein BDZ90DRAFT_232100 [Jaminaea rosea]|uniref:Protein HGH1 homolog n=1 Tax=Jaminaea rosea TaxID=1569628 RepID=A0A316URT5_9BASI|nr:hypothetical protein BDZ90DRAFT_232100 [Jaminaea rosea]PWN27694.1 hypothetical protein BDZ90DRAFT_232100 [Jaminaea rosea]